MKLSGGDRGSPLEVGGGLSRRRIRFLVAREGAGRAGDLSCDAATQGEEIAEAAFGPLSLLDSVVAWPDLERIAKDRRRPEKVRRAAVFWLGQAAVREAVAGLEAMARDSLEDVSLREAAIFSLSQRSADISVPLLIDLVDTLKRRKLVESALFWLAQQDDPRVISFLGAILRRGSGSP